MLSHLSRAAATARRHAVVADRRRGAASATARAAGAGYLAEFRLEDGPAGLALRGRRRTSSRSACSCRTGRTRCTSPTALLAGAGPVRLELRPVGALPRRTTRRSSEPLAGPYALTRGRRSLRARRRRRPAAAAADAARRAARVHARRQPHRRASATASRSSRGYESRGELWSPGYFRADARARTRRVDAGRLDRVVGDDRRRSTPEEALRGRARAARAGCSPRAHPAARDGRRRRARARRRPVHHHAGRPRRGRGPRARRRRRGAHGHRRLPLVHRLGPRHDDQPRRADARHRPARARRATSCARSPTTSATA